MTSQAKRLRQKAKRYTHADSSTIAVMHSLAWQYHCSVIEGREITLKHKGRFACIGSVDDIKAMTLRGLISYFEEITQDWRYEPMNPPIIKSEIEDAETNNTD